MNENKVLKQRVASLEQHVKDQMEIIQVYYEAGRSSTSNEANISEASPLSEKTSRTDTTTNLKRNEGCELPCNKKDLSLKIMKKRIVVIILL